MNTIETFLESKANSTGRFVVEIEGQTSFQSECLIRFIFLDIGTPSPKQTIFLPNYTATLKKANTPDASIFFKPDTPDMPSFSLKNPDMHLLNLWMNFIVNTKAMQKELLNLILAGDPIKFEEPMTICLNNDDQQIPFFVKIEDQKLILEDLVTHEKKMERNITKRTRLYLNKLGEMPSLRIQESTGDPQIYRLNAASYNSLQMWYLAFIMTINSIEEKESQELNHVSVDYITQSPPKSMSMNEIHNNNTTQKTKVNKEKSTENIQQLKQEQQKLQQNSTKGQNVEEKNIELLRQDAIKLEEKLKQQFQNYKKKISKRVVIDEPILEKIDSETVVKNYHIENQDINEITKSYTFSLDEKKKGLNPDDLQKIVKTSLNDPFNKFQRFSPQIVYDQIMIPDVEYDPCDPVYFEQLYQNSSKNDCFLLICAIIYNGFLGNSLSDFYNVTKLPGETKISEVAKILQTLEDQIFDIFLNDERINYYYSPDSLVRDKKMIRILYDSKKEFENPGVLPPEIPFNFPHRPIQNFLHWYYNSHYKLSINMLDYNQSFIELVKCIYSFFLHYNKSQQVYSFFKEICLKMGPVSMVTGPWSVFRSEKNQKSGTDEFPIFLEFWTQSLKEDKLTYNFASIYSYNDIIENHYYACSHVRSSDIASKVASFLFAFEKMNLSNNEISSQKDEATGITFGKGLWKELVENIKIK